MSEEEFEFLKLKRLDFLKRAGYFGEEWSKGRKGDKKEALRGSTNEDSYECIRICKLVGVDIPPVMSLPTF